MCDTEPEVRIISWLDSTIQDHQVDKHNLPKLSVIKSIGFVINDDDDCITLARDNMGNDDYRGLICIPKFAIISSGGDV